MTEKPYHHSEKSLITFNHKGEKKTMFGLTGLWMNESNLLSSSIKSYDTKFYSLSNDDNIIHFYVCDPNFDCGSTHCCKKMIDIFSS